MFQCQKLRKNIWNDRLSRKGDALFFLEFRRPFQGKDRSGRLEVPSPPPGELAVCGFFQSARYYADIWD